MYRNVSYNINKEGSWSGEVTLSTWDEKGERIKYTIDHQSYLYHKDIKGQAKSWFGDNIKLKRFKSTIDRHKWIKTNNLPLFECLTPTNEFLINTFTGTNEDIDDFTKHPMHIAYFDIEIAIEQEFPKPDEAKYPVNLITLYDNFEDKYIIWSLESFDWEDDGDNVETRILNSEAELLKDFIFTFVDSDFDFIVGWNSYAFDMPYIINRSSKLLDANTVNLLSSTKQMRKRVIHFRPDDRYYEGYKLDGISQMDYLLIYKKYSKMLGAEKSSYKLENVCQEELGKGKVEYDGNFRQLYKENFDLFVKYNKQDVKLIVELEQKLEYLKLTRLLCNYSLIEYEGIYYTLGVVVNNLIQFGRKTKLHIPYRRRDDEVDHTKFEGAFVFPTLPGKYDKGIASFDAKSLYPSTMITLNISPEKKVGKVIDGCDGKKIIRLKNGVTKELSETQFQKLFTEKPYSLATNGVIFETKSQGILPAFLESFFNKRVELQKRVKEIQDMPRITKKLKKEMGYAASKQKIFKIILNSVYGSMGTPYSPYYDVDIAEAITLTGQSVTRGAVEFMNEHFSSKYSQPINDEPVVIAGDTDSVASDTKIKYQCKDNGQIFESTIEDLYNDCFIPNKLSITENGSEILDVGNNIKVLNYDNKTDKNYFADVKYLMRHKVSKPSYQLQTSNNSVRVTNDHSCIKYEDDILKECKAKDFVYGDKIIENIGYINAQKNIVNVKKDNDFNDEYVYDIEVNDDTHTFYANNILVHNSVYLNIKYLTTHVLGKDKDLTLETLQPVNEELEVLRQKLNKWCKKLSKNTFYGYKTDRLIFEREIICDIAYFLAKKNYLCHLLDKDGYPPEPGKEYKFTGIAIVKGTYPKLAKDVMFTVFDKTIREHWDEQTYTNYMNEVYENFITLPPMDIATFQNVNKESESDTFLSHNKGDTAGAKGALFYNQLIQKLNLTHKYDLIVKSSKVRLIYINKANKFGIANLAFPEIWPKEFDEYFSVDYRKQFEVDILKPLDKFSECNNWGRWNPDRAEYAVDIMSL